jgi:hypothetical protein
MTQEIFKESRQRPEPTANESAESYIERFNAWLAVYQQDLQGALNKPVPSVRATLTDPFTVTVGGGLQLLPFQSSGLNTHEYFSPVSIFTPQQSGVYFAVLQVRRVAGTGTTTGLQISINKTGATVAMSPAGTNEVISVTWLGELNGLDDTLKAEAEVIGVIAGTVQADALSTYFHIHRVGHIAQGQA